MNTIKIDQDSRGQGRGYSYEVLHQPSFSLAVLQLQAEQAIQAEAGAMVSMSANVELQSQMKGGLFGAIHRKRLQPGERYVVDTGHLVAWEGTTQYTLRKAASGFFRSMMSGEGIVAEFTGPGELLIQTRNLAALAGLLRPFFPSQGGGGGGFNFNLGG